MFNRVSDCVLYCSAEVYNNKWLIWYWIHVRCASGSIFFIALFKAVFYINGEQYFGFLKILLHFCATIVKCLGRKTIVFPDLIQQYSFSNSLGRALKFRIQLTHILKQAHMPQLWFWSTKISFNPQMVDYNFLTVSSRIRDTNSSTCAISVSLLSSRWLIHALSLVNLFSIQLHHDAQAETADGACVCGHVDWVPLWWTTIDQC
jgi:hypothetical protein